MPSTNEYSPINILLVEDNEADRKITLRAFSKGRFKNNLHTASNGEEALDYVLNRGDFQDQQRFPRPDFILMDIKMPRMDGLETLKNLKENPQLRKIPVAMLTSSANEEDICKSYEYGAVTYIPKPVSYDELNQIVDDFNNYWYRVAKLADAEKN